MRYKIGEVAKILGISTDLIRYYEKKGVVKPKKDPVNNYRYYEVSDVNLLIDCIWYKKMGFSIEDIGRMSNVGSYDELVVSLVDRSEEISKDIKYKEMLFLRMQGLTDSAARVREGVGICDVKSNREFLYYLNRDNEVFSGEAELRDLNEEWSLFMPFTKRLFYIDEKALAGESDDYRWGYSIGMKYTSYFSVKAASPVMKMPENLCVHATFASYSKDGFSARRLDFMKEYAKEKGLRLKGFAFGNLVCSAAEENTAQENAAMARAANENLLKGYFEAWMPVEQA